MCWKNIKELENLNINNGDNDLIIITTDSIEEKNKSIINFIIRLAVNENTKVAVLNLKVGISKITKALIQKQIQLNMNKLTNVKKIKVNKLANSNLFLSSSSSIDLEEILQKCKFIKNEKEVNVIVVDEINTLIDYKEQKNIFTKLENMTKLLEIPIIAILHQEDMSNENS